VRKSKLGIRFYKEQRTPKSVADFGRIAFGLKNDGRIYELKKRGIWSFKKTGQQTAKRSAQRTEKGRDDFFRKKVASPVFSC
jgi:hypothetical protein